MTTRAETQQAIVVMQEWLDGAEIEEYAHNSYDEAEGTEPEYTVCSPSWDWNACSYRVRLGQTKRDMLSHRWIADWMADHE